MRKFFRYIIIGGVGFFSGSIVILVNKDHKIRKLLRLSQKLERIIKIYSFWTMNKVSYSEYLKDMGVNKIAIYGVGYLGKNLIDELKNSCVDIMYAIDQNPVQYDSELRIIKLDEVEDIPDMVIVTVVDQYEEIKQILEKKLKCKIRSIEDVIYQLIE